MTTRKDRVKPTHYPVLPFHILRTAQLVSSIVVASVMSYFLWELKHDHYRLPWTFLLLLTVSLLTIFALTATIVLHCCCGLNPILNLVLNSVLAILWTLGFALLSWWSSGTLSHVCNRKNWDNETGVSICRIYKALFAFSLLGFLSTLLALGLDVRTHRSTTRRGKYNAMQTMESKRAFDAPDNVLTLEGPESNPNPSAAAAAKKKPKRGEREGYAVPDEQFAYDDDEREREREDTSYHGAAGQVGRRSVEERI
ncbi:uncharacterized protein BDR25DRAFT_302579 [Lindgomyces ingoldianus]|uniref:Uncharacterized protein n=1 Tax=Lindgomyces ingoldianus TaxID=673940 RepID=A0ACB6QZY4_9PLEO|nr:uncharacterized protein BDR25DRAFT_302579 [Lindgomyces ingoldianus]KAF2472337.1 hypothetical protein BDR25DRAFT_302579 [Lindgomyces ingoldianus]